MSKKQRSLFVQSMTAIRLYTGTETPRDNFGFAENKGTVKKSKTENSVKLFPAKAGYFTCLLRGICNDLLMMLF